jgi:hypothetical protein
MLAVMNGLQIKEHTKENILIREKLAIVFGLSVLSTFIKSDKKSELSDFLERNNSFIFPPAICSDKSYEINWALNLHYAKEENKLFPLSLSNELFWLETYNRQLSETKTC